jgi:hypothetical protein
MSVLFKSSDRRTSLLELYTSEGCSSCPPAEAWLSGLKNAAGLWKDFVPVAFHVHYWDYLGWRDKWSAKTYSERQRTYARLWRSDSVYTPAFVLNGVEWHVSHNAKDGPPVHSASDGGGILKLTSSDLRHWNAEFSPSKPSENGYELSAALLVSGLNSEVKAGENRGRRLAHDFVVLEVVQGAMPVKDGSGRTEFSFQLPSKHGEGQMALAAWVTARESLQPIQATGGWLPHR